jgi:hypothetical protein
LYVTFEKLGGGRGTVGGEWVEAYYLKQAYEAALKIKAAILGLNWF